MVSMNVNQDPYYSQITSTNNFQARAAEFKALTGREIVIEKDDNGDFVHMLNPQSTQRLSFMGEFFRAGFSSTEGFEAAVEGLARRYVDLKSELMERYGDNQDELYRQLGELNQAFESALHSTILLPLQAPPATGVTNSNMSNGFRGSIENEWQQHEAINGFMRELKQNMTRHIDTFFETFIKSIQSEDFDTAFASSMNKMNESESRSLSNMSFRDAVQIFDMLRQGRVENVENRDKTGDDYVFIFNRPSNSLRSIIFNRSVSEVIRMEVAGLMRIAWRDDV